MTTNMNYKNGGNAIGSGGYGCVFRPALKCKNAQRKKGYVTKLFNEEYAENEYNEIVRVREVLKNIPNYKDYFLVDDVSICKVDRLTESDLENFDKECTALLSDDITKETINDEDTMNTLSAVSMRYGGVEMNEYVQRNAKNYFKLVYLNNQLIDLLLHGILPMNELHIYHCDVKSNNILVIEDERRLYTRIIDWGLSINYQRGQPVHLALENYPFQFNCPFTTVLFSQTFSQSYHEFLEENETRPDKEATMSFMISYVDNMIERVGYGHLKAMKNIYNNLFNNLLGSTNREQEREPIDYTSYFIFEYLVQVVTRFTNFETKKQFDVNTYFVEVFSKNVDVWGFVFSFKPYVDYVLKYTKINKKQRAILDRFKSMLSLLIQYSVDPIPVESVIQQIQLLNEELLYLTYSPKKRTSKIGLGKGLRKQNAKGAKRITKRRKIGNVHRYSKNGILTYRS